MKLQESCAALTKMRKCNDLRGDAADPFCGIHMPGSILGDHPWWNLFLQQDLVLVGTVSGCPRTACLPERREALK